MNKDKISEAARFINEAEALIFTAGAGMGVDSNLPDFRGEAGFWKAYPPYQKKGLKFVDMANPDWFRSDPRFAWGFYGHRLNLYRETNPHEGFSILLDWGKKKTKGYFVFTSNVDGHFQKALFQDEKITEVHGSIHFLQCLDNCGGEIFPADSIKVSVEQNTMNAIPPLPECPECGSVARPNILMFGDWGFDGSRHKEQSARFRKWLSTLSDSKVVIIECGAGSAVPTVRITSEELTRHFNAKLIRINVREPDVPRGHISLPVPALKALQDINAALLIEMRKNTPHP